MKCSDYSLYYKQLINATNKNTVAAVQKGFFVREEAVYVCLYVWMYTCIHKFKRTILGLTVSMREFNEEMYFDETKNFLI